MAQEIITNGESGLITRGKLNSNFDELYANLNTWRTYGQTILTDGGVGDPVSIDPDGINPVTLSFGVNTPFDNINIKGTGFLDIAADGGGQIIGSDFLIQATAGAISLDTPGGSLAVGGTTSTPTVFEDRQTTKTGIQYNADYSANYGNRSLADWGSIRGAKTFTGTQTLRTGSAAANTAPLRFVSGALNTTPVVGAEEFLTDKRYTTITTGAARKEYTLWDIAANTTGRVPYVTTNGRLTHSNSLSHDGVGIFTVAQSGTTLTTISTTSIYYGRNAGQAGSTGINNVGIGDGALNSITSGSGNVTIGQGTLGAQQTGSDCIAIGRAALSGAGSKSDNIAIGSQSGTSITTGSYNIAIGTQSGGSNMNTGTQNVTIGRQCTIATSGADGQLNIQNAIYGTSNTALNSTPSSGNVGIYNPTPNSSLSLTGSYSNTPTVTSSDLTLDGTHFRVYVDATGANRSETLPTASTVVGREYFIKKTDATANTVTVVGTIDGATNYVLSNQFDYIHVQAISTGWMIINSN